MSQQAAIQAARSDVLVGGRFGDLRTCPWSQALKRTVDIVGALVLCVLFAPFVLVAMIAVYIEDGWPVLYSRRSDGTPVLRLGFGHRPYVHPKLRTMRKDADARQCALLSERVGLFKIKNDPRVLKAGKLIRRFSVDEMIEIVLVLMGVMSLVGPRPHYMNEVGDVPWRHAVKPGITGLSQVNGRADLPLQRELELDRQYIEQWSPLLDIKILLKTPWAVISGRGAC